MPERVPTVLAFVYQHLRAFVKLLSFMNQRPTAALISVITVAFPAHVLK